MIKKIFITVIICLFYFLENSFCQTPIQWQKCYGGSSAESLNSIIITTDSGFIAAGFSYSNDGDVSGHHGGYDTMDAWVVKVDKLGAIQWQKSYGGTNDDQANCIIQTNDGGYIFAGTTYSNDGDVLLNHGLADYWVVKIDIVGTIQWEKSYGSTGSEIVTTIIQTNDGGYIVSGSSGGTNDGDVTGNHGDWDYWIIKIDSVGHLLWEKSYGSDSADNETSIIQTLDGGYIMSGMTMANNGDVSGFHGGFDYWVVKIDNTGSIQWQKCYGGIGVDQAYKIIQTSDSGYAIAGVSNANSDDVTGNHGYYDYWIVKTDNSGTIQWEQSYGGFAREYASSIIQTSDHGYAIIGSSYANGGEVTGNHGGNDDIWFVKIDSFGGIQWENCFGGSGSDIGVDLIQTIDNGYLIAGNTTSNDGDVTGWYGVYDFWVLKLSPDVGIENINNPNSIINVYPNPSDNNITLSLELPLHEYNQQISIKVYDVFGRVIIDNSIKVIDKLQTDLYINNLANGAYTIQVITKEKTYNKIFIKN